MVKILPILVMLFMVLPNISYADNACKCSNALKILASEIKENNPNCSIEAARGYSGFALMQSKEDMQDCKSQNKISDLQHCPAVGINQETIDLLLKIRHGIISEKAEEELPRCYAAFFVYANAYEKKHGKKSGEKLGYIVGRRLGTVAATLSKTYPQINLSHKQIMDKGLAEYKQLFKIPEKIRKEKLKTYSLYCEKYEIPLKSIMEAAWANTTNN